MPVTIVTQPTIDAGASLSSVLDLTAQTDGLRRITFPAGWTQGALLTFQISGDGVTFSDLYGHDGRELSLRVIPKGTVALEPDTWRAGYFRFRSGTAAFPVVQTEARIFTCAIE